MKMYLLVIVLMLSGCSQKEEEHHDHHEHEDDSRFGHTKAIQEVSELGFRFSKEAREKLDLKLQDLKGSKTKVPLSALSITLNKVLIYVDNSGVIRSLEVDVIDRNESSATIKIIGLKKSDQLITHNIGLVGVSEIFSKDESEYGHAH